jgi:hypothetical protein
MTNDEALYGLRNITIGDDEQTRVGDIDPSVFDALDRDDIASLVHQGRYEEAYIIAIARVLKPLSTEQVERMIAAWALLFVDETEEHDDEASRNETASDLANDMTETFKQLRAAGRL